MAVAAGASCVLAAGGSSGLGALWGQRVGPCRPLLLPWLRPNPTARSCTVAYPSPGYLGAAWAKWTDVTSHHCTRELGPEAAVLQQEGTRGVWSFPRTYLFCGACPLWGSASPSSSP